MHPLSKLSVFRCDSKPNTVRSRVERGISFGTGEERYLME
jgi:hypothetical protein